MVVGTQHVASLYKSHNYWRWLKRKLKLENNELVSATHSFKFIFD